MSISEADKPIRRMPQKFNAGQHHNTCMASPMHNLRTWEKEGRPNPHNQRTVMGYFLPPWQRGFVWTEAQEIAFIESAWRGVGLGTYTINRVETIDHPLDNIIIDGQQRMRAIERYLENAFPIFGWFWSEVTEVDRRFWEMSTAFASYETRSKDEDFLRGYYDAMNFGGSPHTEDQRAAAKVRAIREGDGEFKFGDRVTKTKGASWTGRVVGFYSTTLTPVGYAVESENEPGSVQIYPEAALTHGKE